MSDTPLSPASKDDGLLLEVRDLKVRLELPQGGLVPVDGVSFSLRRNEILCVVGESGSGKTVMMHAILGLLGVAPGVIDGGIITHFGGQPVNLLEGLPRYVRHKVSRGREVVRKRAGWNRLYRKRTRALLGRHLGLIFQNPRNALDPLMSVGRQIASSVKTVNPQASTQQIQQEAVGWLERVRIDRPGEVYHLYPHQLSGGMCQRVAIAQILALRPDILIADEPTTGLDATIQVGILDLIKEVQREFNLSVLLITHDFEVVERLADRVLVMFNGRLLEVGQADELLGHGVRIHPYTLDLLRSVRVLEGAGGIGQIQEIGKLSARPRPPKGLSLPGCNYRSLCPLYAQGGEALQARCQGELPELQALTPSHLVRCHEALRLMPESP